MRNILVTGAAGFVGSALVRQLRDRGDNVRAMVRQNTDLKNLQELDVEIVKADLRDASAVDAAVKGCDVVFHMGAVVAFWLPKKQLGLYDEINVQGSKNVFDACMKHSCEKVIYTSTLSTIGSYGADQPTTEEHTFNLWDMSMEYERSKYSAEFEAWRYCSKGLPVIAVLPSAPIGPRDIKPAPAGQLIIDYLNRKIPAYMDGGANFLHVDDAANGHILALEKGKVGERYLIGGQNISIKELFGALEQLTGVPAPILKISKPLALGYAGFLEFIANNITGKAPLVTRPMTKFSSLHYYLDTSKAKEELGYTPQRTLQLAVCEAVDWFERNGYVKLKSKTVDTVQNALQAAGGMR